MSWEFELEINGGKIIKASVYRGQVLGYNSVRLFFKDEFSNPVCFDHRGRSLPIGQSKTKGSRQASGYRASVKGVHLQKMVAACVWCISHPTQRIPSHRKGGGALHFNGNSDDNHLANLLFISDSKINSRDTLFEGFMAMVYDVLKKNGAGQIDFTNDSTFEKTYIAAFQKARLVVASNLNNSFLTSTFWNNGPFKSAFEHMIESAGSIQNGVMMNSKPSITDRFTVYRYSNLAGFILSADALKLMGATQ
jgi:hypothetical protein